ncbi:MAG: hypothetical protein HYY24_08160 [Verrucomicrobia bacterium]|nr:hypothetical protein [Verrucomicrobiota bacterium]
MSPARFGEQARALQAQIHTVVRPPALTREILLRKRTRDLFGAFKGALDALAEDEPRDPDTLLFDSS